MTAIDTDIDSVKRMFDVNVFGPMRIVHHFRDMLSKAHGTIVNIASVGGILPYIYGSSYNASKAALHHWSNTRRVEMAPYDKSPASTDTIITSWLGKNDVVARRALTNPFQGIEDEPSFVYSQGPTANRAASYMPTLDPSGLLANPGETSDYPALAEEASDTSLPVAEAEYHRARARMAFFDAALEAARRRGDDLDLRLAR
ncbi:uncharacterized protein F4807DRAFT_464965 [Annulohypoxylon truncatum]|uniref:uncharacterized protein n=1 Tax=Annulohypoxylon truncatum TaxID=327061 RepID=UPI00200815BB|nr:uncharacterized protein F4807DRAFT_464965 [Annulohypoxylon truncatum]KAI1205147.1 hypothetical protein F4807DRAFT_464965 [Annulohypoxylon truncatum]